MSFVKAMKTSERDDWETPPEIYEPLNEEFGFTLDPCATHENAKCRKYFTKAEDGLKQDWSNDVVFMNPPYGKEIAKWVRKAWEESQKGATVVALLPARTDTRWFHDYINGQAEVRFIPGRVYFHINGKPKHRAPFPSMIVVFRRMNHETHQFGCGDKSDVGRHRRVQDQSGDSCQKET